MVEKENFKLAQFNLHQEDIRRRADSLCRAIFVMSGGALTLTVGGFMTGNTPDLSDRVSIILKFTWWSLSYSMIALASSLFVIIIRDYINGEKWRALNKGSNPKNQACMFLSIEIIIWLFAISGFLAFVSGFIGIAYVASNLI